MKKEEIIDRVVTKYNGKTFNSNKESIDYLRKLLDAELTGYFNDENKIKLCPKCNKKMLSITGWWVCVDCFFKIAK